jgi:hypothetical protein
MHRTGGFVSLLLRVISACQPAWWRRGRVYLHCLVGAALVSTAICACKRGDTDKAGEGEPPASEAADPAKAEVLLAGDFKRVAKKTSGRAQIVRRGERYQLRLQGVSVDNLGEVQVYLVGLPEVKSTAALTAAETKYDFGPLEQGAKEQLIGLPSKPAPELRSVVLYEPRYRVNLAAASLE